MEEIKLSKIRLAIFFIINISIVVFSSSLVINLTKVILKDNSDNSSMFFILLDLFLVFTLIIYPVVFFIAVYCLDKSTTLYFDEISGEISYKNKNKNVDFNISDIVTIETCYPLNKVALVDYTNIYLSSGKMVTIGCFFSINDLLYGHKASRCREFVFWINELI